MPRYFFHVSGTVTFVDQVGRDLVDDEEAWSLAITSTGELLRDLDGGMPDQADILTMVTNDDGEALISLRFIAERHMKATSH
ncbi:DUF6894 family protein [Aureimonas ureilytica]|uniref:DUF6894 family protein n=1 Tax=Aureimonas ureilytica TaxID=401562 RepID=UPI003CE8D771